MSTEDKACDTASNVPVAPKKINPLSKYTPELAKEICAAIASSNLGLEKLCAMNKHWNVSKMTVFNWLANHEEFAAMYEQAKKFQIHVLIDEIVEISDDSSQDEDRDIRGNRIANNEFINRSRLRVDTRKWLACKLVPRLYGEKVTQEVTGKDGEAIKISSSVDLTRLSDEQLAQFEALVAIAGTNKGGESKA